MRFATALAAASFCSLGSRNSVMAAFVPSVRTALSRRVMSSSSSSSPLIRSFSTVERGRPPPLSADEFMRLFSEVDEEVDPGVVEGTDLRVLKYPHPALRAPNAQVTQEELDDGSIKKLAKEMFLVMYATQGVGLAAPQVGVNKCLMVYNESGDQKKWLDEVVMVNPQIVEFSDGLDVENEGCLSFPNMRGDVERSKWIKVEAQNMKGKKIKKKYKGWEARIFQHEYDHLDGVVYPDRLTEEGRSEVQPRLDELSAEFGEGGAL